LNEVNISASLNKFESISSNASVYERTRNRTEMYHFLWGQFIPARGREMEKIAPESQHWQQHFSYFFVTQK
jgi:hypothetical protein